MGPTGGAGGGGALWRALRLRAICCSRPASGSASPSSGRVSDQCRGRSRAGASSTVSRSRAWARRVGSAQRFTCRQQAMARTLLPWPIRAVASSSCSWAPVIVAGG
ncbi:MAG: hypothetical protein KFB97_09895 [Cyanobium sp. M30B3]|nr:MAG: hypothetical protein KFB97_09895 [Cyanobium sp. M30B3]